MGQTALYRRLLSEIDHLAREDVATPPGRAMCYSGSSTPGGSNHDKALRYAGRHQLVPIDLTPAGVWLDRLNLYNNDSVTLNQATWIWSALSQRYMAEAAGTITAFVEGHLPEKIFSRVELKSFVENPQLTGIQYLDLDSQRKLVWIAREFLEKAARKGSPTYQDAVSHSSSDQRRVPENQLRVYDLSFPVHRLLRSVLGKAALVRAGGEAEIASDIEEIRLLYTKGEVAASTACREIVRRFDNGVISSDQRPRITLEAEKYLEGQISTESLIQTIVKLGEAGQRNDPPPTAEFLSQLRELIDDQPGDEQSRGRRIKP